MGMKTEQRPVTFEVLAAYELLMKNCIDRDMFIALAGFAENETSDVVTYYMRRVEAWRNLRENPYSLKDLHGCGLLSQSLFFYFARGGLRDIRYVPDMLVKAGVTTSRALCNKKLHGAKTGLGRGSVVDLEFLCAALSVSLPWFIEPPNPFPDDANGRKVAFKVLCDVFLPKGEGLVLTPRPKRAVTSTCSQSCPLV